MSIIFGVPATVDGPNEDGKDNQLSHVRGVHEEGGGGGGQQVRFEMSPCGSGDVMPGKSQGSIREGGVSEAELVRVISAIDSIGGTKSCCPC